MIKRILALAIVLTTVLVVFAGCSDTDEIDDSLPNDFKETPASDFEYGHNASLNGVEITGYTGKSMKVRIPEKIDGEPVTSIGRRAFKDSGIVEIYIPNTVTSIGAWAFTRCLELTNITIPNSVIRISYGAFSECTGLTNVTLSDSVTRISYGVFSGCTGLTNIVIPNSVTQIGGDAFSYCAGLTSMTIPNSVTQIDAWAFTGCLGLTNITIPDSIREIESEVFSYCTELTKATYKGTIYNLSTADGRQGLYRAINGGQ